MAAKAPSNALRGAVLGEAAIDSSALNDEALQQLSQEAGQLLAACGLRLATAESCTGGWVSKCLTDIAGSSQWFECAYVTYSNRAKVRSLGVSAEVIDTFGAVSHQTAEQMALGALHDSGADLAVAITGIAGPDGGTADKPIGLVWFALAQRASAGFGSPAARAEAHRFPGTRAQVRRASVATALRWVAQAVRDRQAVVGGTADHAAKD